MKTKIFKFVAFLLILAVNFSACEKKENTIVETKKIIEESDCGIIKINENEYIKMQVVPYRISIDMVEKIRIENHTEKVLGYGHSFYIEYFNDGNWERLRTDFFVTLEGLALLAGETIEYEINAVSVSDPNVRSLYSMVGKYNNGKKGIYRIKKLAFMYIGEVCKGDDLDLCAEFEIE